MQKIVLFGDFPQHWGWGGHPNSQNFCRITKSFLECYIHSEALKHVLQDIFFFQVSLNFGWKKLGKTLKILKNTENLGKYSEKYKW